MAFQEIQVESWQDFDRHVDSMEPRGWVFRGHSDVSWKLESSLYRLFNDVQPIIEQHKGRKRRFAKDRHEVLLIDQFKANAHLYLDALPDEEKRLEWLSIMQHFGAPTRMLDFTFSPHIGAYFALDSGHGDFSIFALKHEEYTNQNSVVFDGVRDFQAEIFKNRKGGKSFLIAYESRMSNERLVAQQGMFIVPSNNYQTLEDILDFYDINGDGCRKFTFPGSLRFDGIRRLKRMNITSATLFPGIDGFCKSLRYQILTTTKSLKKLG